MFIDCGDLEQLEIAPWVLDELMSCFAKSSIEKVFVLTNMDDYNRYGKTTHVVSRLPTRNDEPAQNVRLKNTTFEECLRMLLSDDSANQGVQDVLILTFRHTATQPYLVTPDP